MKNTTLRSLHVGNNPVHNEGNQELFAALCHNTTLRHLDIRYTKMDIQTGLFLQCALKHNSSLLSLNLSAIFFFERNLGVISEGLRYNRSLQNLYLRDNLLANSGIDLLASALRDNTSLRVLDLKGNHLSGVGYQYLADALFYNTTLTELDLSFNCHMGRKSIVQFQKALEQNTSINCIHLTTRKDTSTETLDRLLLVNREPNVYIQEMNQKKQKQVHIFGIIWKPTYSTHCRFPTWFQQQVKEIIQCLVSYREEIKMDLPKKKRRKTESTDSVVLWRLLPMEIWIDSIIPWMSRL